MGCSNAKATSLSLPRNASLVDLLGPSLISASGEIETASAVGGKAAVALYFSAHWCPPCRGFTPKLVEWYKRSLKDKGLEVVFISSDSAAKDFGEYFGTMPWLALPYSDQARKKALSDRFNVQGIPSLVILDANGKVITLDGREAVSNDPSGDDFPWKPKSVKDILSGAKFLGQDGKELTSDVLQSKTLALYFSAHWCPPCRGFTPKLVEWYKQSLKDKGLEVVFVSSDRSEDAFNEYFSEMPWLALDYSDRRRKNELSSLYGVNGIPSLVIIGPDGKTICRDGRAAVTADPEGKDFPWHPN